MTIKLLDYAGNPVVVDVGDIDTIGAMSIEVMAGNEILTVIRKDYNVEKFDSNNDRCASFYDDEYVIYNAAKGFSLLDWEEFINRESSYWFYDVNWEESFNGLFSFFYLAIKTLHDCLMKQSNCWLSEKEMTITS